jgi:hypothetical protein
VTIWRSSPQETAQSLLSAPAAEPLMLCAGEGPTWGRMTSLFWVTASLFSRPNSLFDCLGKISQRGRNTETTKQCRSCDGPSFANFPVFFPVSREFEAETGSQWTASSASQFGLRRALSGFWRMRIGLNALRPVRSPRFLQFLNAICSAGATWAANNSTERSISSSLRSPKQNCPTM